MGLEGQLHYTRPTIHLELQLPADNVGLADIKAISTEAEIPAELHTQVDQARWYQKV